MQEFNDTNYHRYFLVKPRGQLKKAVDLLTKAVCLSVHSNELKLLSVRKNLEGEISLANSWVRLDDFEKWCQSRSIDLNDSWNDFLADDMQILVAGVEEEDAYRRRMEGAHDEESIKSLKEEANSNGPDWLINQLLISQAKIKRLEAKADDREEKPLGTRERNNLLTIIAVLCKEAKLDYKAASKTADLIQSAAASMGVTIGETTIREHLKKIPDALGTRMK